MLTQLVLCASVNLFDYNSWRCCGEWLSVKASSLPSIKSYHTSLLLKSGRIKQRRVYVICGKPPTCTAELYTSRGVADLGGAIIKLL